jgi:hypothetical protein
MAGESLLKAAATRRVGQSANVAYVSAAGKWNRVGCLNLLARCGERG